MKNQVFIPTTATSIDDLTTSLSLMAPLKKHGYKTGLMLVIKGGVKGVTKDAEVQYSNLKKISKRYDSDLIVIMLSNFPLEEIDFLHNTSYATEHVKKGIDFSNKLPIGGRKILTFHLNSLITETEFLKRDKRSWRDEFNRILVPALEEIAQYSKEKNIEAKVETDPTPPFGDISFTDKRTYRNVKLNELRSPFYITNLWEFKEVYNCGLGICLDLCHNRTVYLTAKSEEHAGILFSSDIEELRKRSLFDDVKSLKPSDLVHLNDGLGIYSKTNKTIFKEGVVLGRGDIFNLKEIITYLDSRKTPYVLEIDDKNFKKRKETKESISFLSKIN